METLTEPKAAQGTISALDESGDFKVTWTHGNEAETNLARESYDKLKKKGYAAFRMLDGGRRGEQLLQFDATAEQIIMVPAQVGG